jgi:hypothetical protein
MKLFPLDILLVNDDPHNYDPAGALHRLLHHHPAVRAYGIASPKKALHFLRQGKVNTLFVSPGFRYFNKTLQEMKRFISIVESECPRVVVVLFAEMSKLIHDAPEFESYFKIDISDLISTSNDECKALNEVLLKCDDWHNTRYDYDLAFSFAGENRQQAECIAEILKKKDVRVFYDQFEQASLFGKDLYVRLYEVYAKRSRYCVILTSEHYLYKMWTIHERRAAQERTLQERGAEYILPVRIDDTEIPGMATTVGYLSYKLGPKKIADALVQKLWQTQTSNQKRYIGYSLYDYDISPLCRKYRRLNPQYPSLYIPPSLYYELIRNKEEADHSAIEVARLKVINNLMKSFPEFADKLKSLPENSMDEILPGITHKEILACEEHTCLLPNSYKQFLESTRGFWLFDGCVQFRKHHPYLQTFPKYDDLPEEGKKEVEKNGGLWPPPSAGMLTFAEYITANANYSVLFDVPSGIKGGEYSIVYYDYMGQPPSVRKVSDSFSEWLNKHCLEDIDGYR